MPSALGNEAPAPGAAHDLSGLQVLDHAPSEHGHQRQLGGWALRAATAVALSFSVFQLLVAAYSPLSSLVTRSLHVGFLMLLAFLWFPASGRSPRGRLPWFDLALGLTAFVIGLYHWRFEADIVQRAGEPDTLDLAVGVAAVALLFEAARRVLGLALPLVCAAFLAYAAFGQYLPGELAHRPFGFDQIVSQLYLDTEGIYGIPTLVSATYIFLFILFGAFLEHAGMIRLFNELALGFVGHAKGGPAKVAVVSSGFMGTISGSGVANVLTVGQFTIPLMKRFGYSGVFAGAVEATASMGGQIMPPVMGAVAFIMAETLNRPYAEICIAAAVPALLYYATAFWMVHLEAGRAGLVGLAKDQCPDPWQAIRRSWYLLLPLVALVAMLFHGFTPMFAGMTGLALTATLILGTTVASAIGPLAFRYAFWLALGVAASFFAKFGIGVVIGLIAALVLACLGVQGGRATLATLRASLVDGARQAVPVGIACAIVGVIIGSLTLTGAATSFAGYILQVGQTSLFFSLVLTMLVCLVLGMGIPTIPNYIITSAIAAPALLKLGVPLIVSHMFVFYFGIMADLTPPVALAAFAAASIAKESALKIGVKATQIAIAGFVIPYMAVYDPALMLQPGPDGHLNVADAAYVIAKAVLAIALWGATAVGHLGRPLPWAERLWTAAAACLLVAAVPATDAIGFGAAALFFVWHGLQRRRDRAAKANPG